jgi:hypothetical protein
LCATSSESDDWVGRLSIQSSRPAGVIRQRARLGGARGCYRPADETVSATEPLLQERNSWSAARRSTGEPPIDQSVVGAVITIALRAPARRRPRPGLSYFSQPPIGPLPRTPCCDHRANPGIDQRTLDGRLRCLTAQRSPDAVGRTGELALIHQPDSRAPARHLARCEPITCGRPRLPVMPTCRGPHERAVSKLTTCLWTMAPGDGQGSS